MNLKINRIAQTFIRLHDQRKKALVTYITAGDPCLSFTLQAMHELVEAGADILEIGFPFSEPVADGPVIQRAVERSLRAGTTLSQVLDMVGLFRKSNQTTPVVLMGYFNPLFHLGVELFAEKAAKMGVDGVLVVDLPVEITEPLHSALEQRGVENIFLLTPTTPRERARIVVQKAGGYLYYVSVKGVTGSHQMDTQEVRNRLKELRPQLEGLPLVVGFGVRQKRDVRLLCQAADGIVVGSRLIEEIEKAGEAALPALGKVVRELKEATAGLGVEG